MAGDINNRIAQNTHAPANDGLRIGVAVHRNVADRQDAAGARGIQVPAVKNEVAYIVAEGRDIGTVVFPQAEVKIFLQASAAERARRRFAELQAAGQSVDLTETLREIEERDKRDSERDLAPLRQADDALMIDSSSVDANQVTARVLAHIGTKTRENQIDRS